MATVLKALGLMSGTSMDGIDAAIVETDGAGILRPGPARARPYSAGEQALVRAALPVARTLADRAARPPELAAAEAAVTAAHAEAVEALIAEAGLTLADIDVVGFHGQTVFHDPARRLTIQLGDGAALARRLGIPVVYDFRAADVAAGGEGAPFVPVYHRALVGAAGLALPAAVVNIGGVANITWIGADGGLLACDTGPGNALLDDLMRERAGRAFDEGGRHALAGRVDAAVLARLLDDPYFALPAPKSLDRDHFSAAPVAGLGLEDAAATLAAFTAAPI
ncbi:MAG TPA: anhydro-N-acetylmuramic acid kinase, partial [Kaistiaceae bacterium]|nr:anhydro-N-acetylmuramic acid kinase [Kaistiaceae bacterium]